MFEKLQIQQKGSRYRISSHEKIRDTIFADITISLRGDTSFERAHEISDSVERNIKNQISNAKITIHFEPQLERCSTRWKNF